MRHWATVSRVILWFGESGAGSFPAVKATLLSLAVFFVAASCSAPLAEARTGAPTFRARLGPIDAETRALMRGVSWRPGCPVGFGDLRLLRVRHWGFDGRPHYGRLVVNRRQARGMLVVMASLYRQRFPIRRMHLVDAYGADDRRSMAADNTSAFNCRYVAGRPGVWSEHAYGKAIDINPVENPYVTGSGYVSPPAGAPFAVRSPHRKGMIRRGGAVVAAFAEIGWEWGGNWAWPKDYQHFSESGS